MNKLVLLSCCAPCSAGAIRQLRDELSDKFDDFIVLFYNPNIYPESEYLKRLDEQIKYCEQLGVKYAAPEYVHNKWLAEVKGLESEPEQGRRCTACFRHRFAFAKRWAIDNGYNAIASILGVSKHKNQTQVDAAAESVISEIKYIKIDWDNDLKQKINKESNFYRQNYCGCEFSFRKV